MSIVDDLRWGGVIQPQSLELRFPEKNKDSSVFMRYSLEDVFETISQDDITNTHKSLS